MRLLVIWLCALLICCQKEETSGKKDKITPPKKKFEMYSMSEMSLLMEQMYVDHQRLKERINKGEEVGVFPDYFLKIHSAAMTDSTENDSFFKAQAARFIEAQKRIYADPSHAKVHFNEGVNACLACHQVKCGGPIPRIKKLYID